MKMICVCIYQIENSKKCTKTRRNNKRRLKQTAPESTIPGAVYCVLPFKRMAFAAFIFYTDPDIRWERGRPVF